MIASLYIHTFTVSRPTRTADGQGGWSIGYADAGTVVGRLRPVTATERTVGQLEQAHITHVLYCATEADIRRDDLVSGADVTVKVLAIREPSRAGHHLEIDAEEIQKEGQQEAGS